MALWGVLWLCVSRSPLWEYKDPTEKNEPYRGTEGRLSVADKMGKVSTEKCVIPQKSEFSELFGTK